MNKILVRLRPVLSNTSLGSRSGSLVSRIILKNTASTRPLSIMYNHKPKISKVSSMILESRRYYGFKRINVTSPFLVGVLKFFRGTLRGFMIFYFASLAIISGAVATVSYYLNQYEKIPLIFTGPSTGESVSLTLKVLLKMALFNELLTKRLDIANEYLMVFLRHINRSHGLKFDKDSEKLEEYLNNEEILQKGKNWYNLYTDVLLRLAIIKGQMGNIDDAKPFLEKAKSFIDFVNDKDIDVGNRNLRNKGLRLLAKIYERENQIEKTHSPQAIESLYFDSLITLFEQYPEVMTSANIKTYDQMLVLNEEVSKILSRDLYNTINELAAHYSKNNETKTAFKIFLNNLIFLQKNKDALTGPSIPSVASLLDGYFQNQNDTIVPFKIGAGDIPLLKFHLAELLWSFGNHEAAINWTKESFIESFNYSKQDKNCAILSKLSIETLKKMYLKLNKKGKYDKKIERCENLSEEIYLPTYSSGTKMIVDNMR
ncbi:hypothetical protein DASC09_013690 [Saccharomycopsis crataegensis]|uniref:Uncharacterized protein n=1 Tax=Saccharomycopsis crataegensis TaxID=43959 RepID=A0AAV5QH35_9ASCO|nr:hypothetical protein DASC09_013690 [Saccharomycopsis crataegensis]